MTELSRKIVVPDAMRKAAGAATDGVDPEGYFLYHALEGALRWLDDELEKLLPKEECYYRSPSMSETYEANGRKIAIAAMRRLFVAEPEVPDAVADLLLWHKAGTTCDLDKRIIEAYNRGRKAGEK